MRFIGLKTCDTCRKARRALTAAGIDYAYTDVRADGLSTDLIAEILGHFPETAVNKASNTWRGLTDAQKDLDSKELLAEFPTLLKRPVIVADEMTIGWAKATQEKWLGV